MKPLPFLEAIAFAKTQKVILPDVYYGERIGLARAQARTISNLAGVDQIQAVFDVLDKHLANGGTFKSFRDDIASNKIAVGLPKHRLELVFRNNIQTAYNGGRWQQFQQSKTSHPYLRYSAVNDGRTRPTHRAMHGHIARVDDVWWTTHSAPNGHRCRCTTIALTEAQAKRYGIPSKPPANAQPDQGWDYNAGQAPMDGLKQSAEHKKTTVNKKLVKAVEQAVNTEHAPVSAAIVPLGYKRIAKHVLGVIDAVHTDGRLPLIPLKRVSTSKYYGAFSRRGMQASHINLSSGGDHQAFTLAHEIGHFIDLEGIGDKGGFASQTSMMNGVMSALENSNLYGELESIVLSKDITTKEAQHIGYLISEKELWARAYSQWVATKSQDVIMLDQLKGLVIEGESTGIPTQWTNNDFMPIMDAIDVLMEEMKWLTI